MHDVKQSDAPEWTSRHEGKIHCICPHVRNGDGWSVQSLRRVVLTSLTETDACAAWMSRVCDVACVPNEGMLMLLRNLVVPNWKVDQTGFIDTPRH